jgi:RNA polymerase sigma factor FliA
MELIDVKETVNELALSVPLQTDKGALVEQYGNFVRSIAKQVKKSLSPKIELDDLIAYGMAGLLEAAERYNPSFGANFTTFSYYRVRGAIYDGLRGMGWVSRYEYQKIRFGERATAYLENVANRDMAASNQRKNTQEEIENLSNQVNQLVTIFVTSMEDLKDTDFEDKQAVRQDAQIEEKELRYFIKQALHKLPAQDQELIRLYYFKGLSLEAVGEKIGLSKSWTCRRHAQVIEKLSLLLKELMQNPAVQKTNRGPFSELGLS